MPEGPPVLLQVALGHLFQKGSHFPRHGGRPPPVIVHPERYGLRSLHITSTLEHRLHLPIACSKVACGNPSSVRAVRRLQPRQGHDVRAAPTVGPARCGQQAVALPKLTQASPLLPNTALLLFATKSRLRPASPVLTEFQIQLEQWPQAVGDARAFTPYKQQAGHKRIQQVLSSVSYPRSGNQTTASLNDIKERTHQEPSIMACASGNYRCAMELAMSRKSASFHFDGTSMTFRAQRVHDLDS